LRTTGSEAVDVEVDAEPVSTEAVGAEPVDDVWLEPVDALRSAESDVVDVLPLLFAADDDAWLLESDESDDDP